MLTTLIYLLAFVFVLSLVVVVHEGGHFMIARACGVKVTDFSIGFGKELWSRVDKRGTRWKVCAVPLGGYVKMLGDEDAASAKSSDEGIPEEEKKYTFLCQPLWKRASIIFAGPAMNYIFAIFVLTGIIWTMGEIVRPPVVGELVPNMPAEKAGILKGDRFLSINGKDVKEYADIQRAIRLTEFGKVLNIVLDRNGEQKEIRVLPEELSDSGIPQLGIKSSIELTVLNENLSLWASFKKASLSAYQMTVDTLIYLKQILVDHRSPKDMRGPLGIAEASGDALKGGLLSLLVFIVQISIAIGFMNLLPIPVLDGGHLAFYAVEAVRGKPLSDRTQNMLLFSGLSILLVLFAYTMFLDVPRIMQRILG